MNYRLTIPSLPCGTWEGKIRTMSSREPLLFVPSRPIMGVQDVVWAVGKPIDLLRDKIDYGTLSFWCNMTGVTVAEVEGARADLRKQERDEARKESLRKLQKAAREQGFKLVRRAKPKRRKK